MNSTVNTESSCQDLSSTSSYSYDWENSRMIGREEKEQKGGLAPQQQDPVRIRQAMRGQDGTAWSSEAKEGKLRRWVQLLVP